MSAFPKAQGRKVSKYSASRWKINRAHEKLWAGLAKVNTHSGVHACTRAGTCTHCINISANCPQLTRQPPHYLGSADWVTVAWMVQAKAWIIDHGKSWKLNLECKKKGSFLTLFIHSFFFCTASSCTLGCRGRMESIPGRHQAKSGYFLH